MTRITRISYALPTLLLLVGLGCDSPVQQRPQRPGDPGYETPACVFYAPQRIDILPLTEFKSAEGEVEPRLDAYVSLLDSAGCQMKFPAKFRFELYEHVQRSAETKGRRLRIWPEIDTTDPNEPRGHWFDLSEPAENHVFWQDFVRAYRFRLSFRPEPGAGYILEATCLTNNGRRLTAEVSLRQTK